MTLEGFTYLGSDGDHTRKARKSSMAALSESIPTTSRDVSAPSSSSSSSKFYRVLVTGGAGFLGSHLCRRLVSEGHDVVCLDNFFTSSKAAVSDLMEKPNFELVRHDVTVPYRVEVDRIYNLACPASPVHYQYNPIKTLKTSYLGAVNMLGLAKRLKARVLQASTSEVYGDPAISPQVESYWGNVNPIGVRSCYDEGKRVAETLFFDYHRQHNVDIRVARIFNTYGPGLHPYDGRVVSNFIMQALDGQDITIFGDGSQTRSFCFVDDLIEGLVRLMRQERHVGPMNLGNPEEVTISQLAELIVELIPGTKSKVVYLPLPMDDPKKRKPNIALAQEYLDGWTPSVQLREGLLKTISYFRNLDLRYYKKPTTHTAHKNSNDMIKTKQLRRDDEE